VEKRYSLILLTMTYIGTSYNTVHLINIKIRGMKIAIFWIVMPCDDSNL